MKNSGIALLLSLGILPACQSGLPAQPQGHAPNGVPYISIPPATRDCGAVPIRDNPFLLCMEGVPGDGWPAENLVLRGYARVNDQWYHGYVSYGREGKDPATPLIICPVSPGCSSLQEETCVDKTKCCTGPRLDTGPFSYRALSLERPN